MNRDGRYRRRLLLASFLLTAALAGIMMVDRRVPRGHEAGTSYALQHFFLCAASQDGAVPLWVPFAGHGTPGGPLLAAQSGLLQPLLLLAAPALEGSAFPAIFHLGILAEEIVLLLGSWMLASRYYRSARTAFFVSIAAVGSSLSVDNSWVNLHVIFSLPLVAALLHDHAENGASSRLLLAGLWTALATGGLPPSLVPVPLVLATLYAILLHFPFRPLAPAAFILALLPLAAAALPGCGALEPDGPPPAASWTHPADLVLGIVPDLDASLYCGYFTLALAVLGLAWTSPALRRRILGSCLGALLALGVLFTLFAPTRSLPVCAPVLRLVLVFLSGLGFEKLLENDAARLPSLRKGAGALLALSAVLAVLSAAAVLDEEIVEYLVEAVSGGVRSPLVSDLGLVSELLGVSSLTAGLAGGAFLIHASGPRGAAAGLFLILLLHPLDLMGWKFRMSWLKTLSATPDPSLRHVIGALPWRETRPRLDVLLRKKRALEVERPRLVPRTPVYGRSVLNPLQDVLDAPAPLGLRTAGGTDLRGDKIRFSPSLAYRVSGFGAGHLEVRVDVPPGGARMVYADAWAPGWEAEVNGTAVPIQRADPSYKAVDLGPGISTVRLTYRSLGRAWAYRLAALSALLGLLSIPVLAARAWRHDA